MSETQPIQIEQVTAATADARRLVGELDHELAVNYPPEQRHGLTLEQILQLHVRFFLARVDGAAVGCGAIMLYPDFAEVKRMYVRKASRGRGIADALLAKLEAEALAARLRVLRLETGIHQPAAIRFYQRCGFQPCAIFEPYTSMPLQAVATSVFLEKKLSAPSDRG